jgi:hypothetical protein
MEPSRPDLTSVRRAVGVAVVSFLLSGGIVYLVAPDFLGSGSDPTTADSAASPAPTRIVTQTARPGGPSSSAGRSPAPDATPSASTKTSGTGDSTGSGPVDKQAISVETPADSAKPFQTVPIRGRYHGGADTFVRVQRWDGGRWQAFPLPARTDQSGQFTAFVELGEPGLYWLRVLDPDSRVKSKPFLLVIKG